MINYNDLRVRTGVGGDGRVQTLSGSITLEEGTGRLVVRDGVTNDELVRLDRDGFLFNDGNYRRILLGRFATRVGLWISKPGIDVIDTLNA